MLIQLACIHTYNDNTVTGCWYVCGGVVRVAPLSEAYLFIIHTLANQGCQQAVLPCIVPAAPPVIQEMVLLDSGLKMARESNRYHALGKPLYYLFSRAVDLAVAVPLLLALSPVFLLIALLIKLDSPGPAIFVQTRVGGCPCLPGDECIGGARAFKFYKFRTMYKHVTSERHRQFMKAYMANDHAAMAALQNGEAKGSNRYKLIGDPRVTRVGRFLRRTSLDELPQLWNVIKVDMSLVGPRPAIPYEVEMYEPWHQKRLLAMPGITGLWQVTKRSASTFDDMARLDIWYLEHRSPLLYLLILACTPFVMLAGKGAG